MRAGLLSDPRVVVLLREHFVPVMTTALNTGELFVDPRDEATLRRLAKDRERTFQGGAREAFVLPDGTMLDVFLSLAAKHGDERVHKTRAGRRLVQATAPFRAHAEQALRRCHDRLPEQWQAIWDGSAEAVREIAAASPRWRRPRGDGPALRVFVRNGALAYDELCGTDLVPFDDRQLFEGPSPGALDDRATVSDELFRRLVHAMVPRGMVAPQLDDGSIAGELVLTVTEEHGAMRSGIVRGRFAMRPADRREAGRRHNAACLFEATGDLTGTFTFDLAQQRLQSLRVVAEHCSFTEYPPVLAKGQSPRLPLSIVFELVRDG